MRWKSWISLILVAFMSFPGTAIAPPPQREEAAVWNAQVSYTVKFSSPRYGDGYQKQTFTAMYQIDKSGAPINGNILFSDEGRLKGEFPGGQWWEGMKKCESTEWSVTDSHIFKAPEELSPGNEAGIRGVALPVVLGPHIIGNRRFVSGESGIVVSVRGFYPNAMTGPCEDDCGKRCNHDVEVDINSGPTAGSGFEVIEGSPPESPPEIEISPAQEAQEEAQWEARVKAWLKKPGKEKDEEFQQEVEKWSIAEMQRSGMIELKGNAYQGSRQWTESNPVKLIRITHTLTWHFSLIPEDVEAVMWVDVKEYEEWLPEGYRNGREDEAGLTPLRVNVKLHLKGKPNEKVKEKATFRFELVDVSTEPGVAINWPHQANEGLKGTPDLAIEDIHNQELAVEATWQTKRGKAGPKAKTKKKDTEAEVIISSFDYGAYGTLKIYADVERGGTVVAYLKDKPSVKELKLPKDENNNHIADKWEKDMGMMGKAVDSDEDIIPRGDGTKGDGLSVFEEYRGFMALDDPGIFEKHVRTHPKRKTLFINYTDIPNAKGGVDLFGGASGLEVISINEEQYGNNTHRLININSKTGRSGIPQHGLWIKSWVSDKWGGQSPIGPPRFVDKVEIAAPHPDTIAHELGHAVGMPHNGKGNYDIPSAVRKSAYVAVQHGQNSGGEPCLMRYNTADYVEKIEGKRKNFYPYYRPNEKGEKITQFCTGDEGTGVNAPQGWTLPDGRKVSKAGDATKDCGNSLRYIRISDKYDSPWPWHEQRGCL